MSVMSKRLAFHKENGHRVHFYLRGGVSIQDPKFILDFDETSVLVSNHNPPIAWSEPYIVMVHDISRFSVSGGYNPDFDEHGKPVSDDQEEEND